MSARYYEQHLQDVDGKPKLSVETIPEIYVSHPSAETLPEFFAPPSYTPTCAAARIVPLAVPERPSERMEQHVQDVITIGEQHDEKPGTKRVRFDDHGLSPVRRARTVELVEQMAASDEDGKEHDDKDIIELAMISIEGLQQDRDHLEVENIRLRALKREQTASSVRVLKEIVRYRGVQLKAHGEFLIKMAHSGSSECS